jgi:hypothetical protein
MKHSVSWFIFNLHKKEMHTKQNSQDILSNCGWTCDEKSFTWGGDFQSIATSMLYSTLVPCSTVHWSHALLYTGPMLYCTLVPCSTVHWSHALLYTGPMLYCTLVPCSTVHWSHAILCTGPHALLYTGPRKHGHRYAAWKTSLKKIHFLNS